MKRRSFLAGMLAAGASAAILPRHALGFMGKMSRTPAGILVPPPLTVDTLKKIVDVLRAHEVPEINGHYYFCAGPGGGYVLAPNSSLALPGALAKQISLAHTWNVTAS